MEDLLKQILDEIKRPKSIEPTGIYTPQDLAAYMGCDYGVILKWLKHGLKHRKIGRTNYMLGKDILDFFDEEEDLKYSEGSSDRIQRMLREAKC